MENRDKWFNKMLFTYRYMVQQIQQRPNINYDKPKMLLIYIMVYEIALSISYTSPRVKRTKLPN